MALKESTKEALNLAEDYAVRVINELARSDAKLENWKTLEIDEAIDILEGVCFCKYKDHCMKAARKGGPHSFAVHGTMEAGSGTGHYGR